jgi:hypothetical protein
MDELLEMAADETDELMQPGTSDCSGASTTTHQAEARGNSVWPVKTEATTTAMHIGEGPGSSSMMVVDNALAISITALPAQHTPKVHLQIMDFTPAQDHQVGGGTKVLIILAREIPPELHRNQIYVRISAVDALPSSVYTMTLQAIRLPR